MDFEHCFSFIEELLIKCITNTLPLGRIPYKSGGTYLVVKHSVHSPFGRIDSPPPVL